MPKSNEIVTTSPAHREFTAAELALVAVAIDVCPQYRWMRALGPVTIPLSKPIGRWRLRWRLLWLGRVDRRAAREWIAENLTDGLTARRWRRQIVMAAAAQG